MKNIKMIVTDLDMTVLHSNKDISDYTIDVFRKCKQSGIITTIATARYFIGAERYIKELKPNYEIVSDGAMIYDNNKFLSGTEFDIETTNSILQELLSFDNNLDISLATNKNVFWNNKFISESPILYKAVYNNFSIPLTECAYKILAILPDESIASRISKKYDCKVIHYRGENKYGFVHKLIGKIQAIRQISKSLKIQMSEIVAFGDDLNDIEMLSECGYGIAVANALNEVKDIADVICESNDNDGVARFIEKNILHDK